VTRFRDPHGEDGNPEPTRAAKHATEKDAGFCKKLQQTKGLFAVLARNLCLAVAGVVLGAGSGCGTKASNFVKVSGVVTLDGAPLAGAKVTYYPSSGEAPALGITDGAGKFQLSTFDMKTLKSAEGALPGDYRVTVEMPAPAGRNPGSADGLEVGHIEREKAMTQKAARKASEVKVLHANYGDVSTTPLKQVIPPQGTVELNLTKTGT
jgi:hypothetical protein